MAFCNCKIYKSGLLKLTSFSNELVDCIVLTYRQTVQVDSCQQMYMLRLLQKCRSPESYTCTIASCQHQEMLYYILATSTTYSAFCQPEPASSSTCIICFMLSVLSGVFYNIKPSSLTSHMVNLRHGWYPHTRSFLQLCRNQANL